jgi:hypothetical protein
MAYPTQPKQLKLDARRGYVWPFQGKMTDTVYNSSGTAQSLTSTTLTGELRNNQSYDSYQVATFTITKEATTGEFSFSIPAATTQTLTAGRTYWYFVKASDAGWTAGNTEILYHGPVYVEA